MPVVNPPLRRIPESFKSRLEAELDCMEKYCIIANELGLLDCCHGKAKNGQAMVMSRPEIIKCCKKTTLSSYENIERFRFQVVGRDMLQQTAHYTCLHRHNAR